ncbi:MAG: 2-succinyl-5-enolpyruvyl-6-hydroxy-3-cyclohexene-1-carboxylic-acid synthase [Flavobacteriaceae bacterium]
MNISNKLQAQELMLAMSTYGLTKAVISPGSRNAPLTISLTANPEIDCYSVVDERAAGFFALGMAQQSGKPVVLTCTSGSALLNYYPAIAEAYYSKIPLVIVSADRPEHLIDRGDGQTIRQKNVFENHILDSVNLIEDEPSLNRMNQALETALSQSGPVHINMPFNEPIYELMHGYYPSLLEAFEKQKPYVPVQEVPLPVDEVQVYANKWNSSSKKLVLIGAKMPNELAEIQVAKLLKDPSVLVFCESLSNIHHPNLINQIDQLIFLLKEDELEALRPDILVTYGGLIVSKKIKQVLRTYSPKEHWHVDALGVLDTYFCLTKHFKISPELFWSQFFFLTEENLNSNYQSFWLERRNVHRERQLSFVEKLPYCDFKVFSEIIKQLPSKCMLQLSNSSVVRYVQLFEMKPQVYSFANRGTSGIDGSSSTAIGAAVVKQDHLPTVFISGDTSFMYDSNAWWNSYVPKNLRVIVINNNGGGIFRILPGPSSTEALSYFETSHNRSVEHLCKMHSLDYLSYRGEGDLNNKLTTFFNVKESVNAAVLEIFVPKEANDKIIKEYFKHINGYGI